MHKGSCECPHFLRKRAFGGGHLPPKIFPGKPSKGGTLEKPMVIYFRGIQNGGGGGILNVVNFPEIGRIMHVMWNKHRHDRYPLTLGSI